MKDRNKKGTPRRVLMYALLLAAAIGAGLALKAFDFAELAALFTVNGTALLKLALLVFGVLLAENLVVLVLGLIRPTSHRACSVLSLTASLVRYVAVIVILCGGLGILGVNIGTIIASVGVLALIVGFSAESLIADVVIGAFMLLENQYNVGDIVEVNGFRGTVTSIGIRTTCITDSGDNVKIINNSEMKNILNRSDNSSKTVCDISIPYYPTGKKRLQQALRDGDLDYVVSQGISQQEQGADILDVNVGLPEIDEVKIIQQATEQLQGSTLLPLQIDSTDPAAVEAAVRRYAGKPIINSVNGKQQIMDEIFPLVAHYGTNVVGLTLDEGGIPDSAEARFAIAEHIVAEAARYGIGPDRILIDCLVMTASTNQRQAEQILRAMSLCKERLGVKCALGVSNISFGLPARPLLGSVFLAAAFGAGLDAPIMNPGSKRFMDTVYSYRVLSVEDEGSTGYIERYAGWTDPYKIAANPAAAQAASSDAAPAAGTAGTDGNDDPIRRMVVSGRKGEIAAETERLLTDHDAMDLINNHFIPALDEVGVLFDQGKFFLPQLMASAEAARVGFDTIKRLMPAGEIADKGKICVATVKGDIHDIGKNIVKMLLDNYGYTVFDLGRDVDPQEVLKTVKERDIKLVGLSALMTTTVVAMEETIKLLHAEVPGVKIIVGGAVLTPEYAKQIGADYYAKDAAESARIAEEVFGQ